MEHTKRLLDEFRAEVNYREQELELLHEIDLRLLNGAQQPDELFPFIVQRTQDLMQVSHTTILLRRSTFLIPQYSSLRSVAGQRVPINASVAGISVETGTVVNVPDIQHSPHVIRYVRPREYRGPATKSLLAIPIDVRGTPVGVLCLESSAAGFFKPSHEQMAQAIAVLIAIGLQQSQALHSTALFAAIDELLLSSDDSPRVIHTALERVMTELRRLEDVEYSGAQILLRRENNELEVMYSTNPPDIGLILPIEGSVSGQAVRERKTIIIGDVTQDHRYRRMSGDSPLSEIAVPILYGEDEAVIGILNVESDQLDAFQGFSQIVLESFSERIKVFLAFVKLRADVAALLEMRSANDLLLAIGDQTSHMVHRINNTVGALRLRILDLKERVQSGRIDKRFLSESLEEMTELASRALQIPDELVSILGQENSPTDINEVIKHAIGRIRIPSDVVLDVQLDERIPALLLYSFDIVVANLLQNAIDAMRHGGRLSISTSMVTVPTGPGYFTFSVKDTGEGIPAELRGKVFDLNFSTKRADGKGLGLGLWWVRTFVRRDGGEITLQSTAGEGTEVTVKIPLRRSAQ